MTKRCMRILFTISKTLFFFYFFTLSPRKGMYRPQFYIEVIFIYLTSGCDHYFRIVETPTRSDDLLRLRKFNLHAVYANLSFQKVELMKIANNTVEKVLFDWKCESYIRCRIFTFYETGSWRIQLLQFLQFN